VIEIEECQKELGLKMTSKLEKEIGSKQSSKFLSIYGFTCMK